jgi:hypothetical protein
MVLSRDPSQIADVKGNHKPAAAQDDRHLWSDDFSDLLSVMKSH